MGKSYTIEASTEQGAMDKALEFKSTVYRRFRRNANILAVYKRTDKWAAIVDVCGFRSLAIDETAKEIARG